jgi:hypothetical protein
MLGQSNRPAGMDASPSATAARQALADAVGKHGQAELVARKLSAAFEDAKEKVYDAMHVTDAARAALEKAAKLDSDSVRAAALAGAPIAPLAAQRAATEKVTAAEEELDHARAVRDALEGEVREANTTLAYAVDRVKRAAISYARASSAQSLAKYISETEELQAKLIARIRGLQFLVREGVIDDTSDQRIGGFFNIDPRHWSASSADGQAEIAGTWQAMLERLTRDAGAPAELK